MTDLHGDAAAPPEPTAQELHAVRQAELLGTLLAPDPPTRGRRWPYLALVVVLVVAGLGVAVALRESGPQGPPHPSAWDPKVQAYVDFVEEARDLEFVHPVYVDFLSEEDFEAQVTTDADEVSDADREELAGYVGSLRALGLVTGDVDLLEQRNTLSGKGVIGFYSYDDERLRIRGTEITPAVESTIVHELTHALQDQHFDLGKRFAELASNDDERSSAAADGFDALVEGDARRIETRWAEGLPAKKRAKLLKEQRQGSKGFAADAKDVPGVLVTLMGAPYTLGEALLAVAVQQGGERAVDDLFRSPPSTEEQQLDPWTLVADHQGYLSVPEPALPDGAEAEDQDVFGSVGWLMVLSQRLPVEQAMTAVDGWGGDAFASYTLDGVSCVAVDYRGDTPLDLTQMRSALDAWVGKGPKGSASVEVQGQTLSLRSCDPGKAAPKVAPDRSQDALTRMVARTYLSLALAKSGVPVAVARCGADRMVRTFTMAQLKATEPDPELMARAQRALAPCLDS